MYDDQYRLPDRARARSTDPQTSHDAAASQTPLSLTRGQAIVIHLFRVHRNLNELSAEYGMTDVDFVSIAKHHGYVISESGLRTRRCELVDKHLLEDSGFTRMLLSGRKAIIWRIA